MISLRPYNTFKVSHKAADLYSIESVSVLQNLVRTDPNLLILGDGSNVLITEDIKQKIAVINLKGRQIIEERDSSVIAEFGAGENWHEVVLWAIRNDLGGIENLSLIPGKCGAAPMQNIGAYGVELSDTLISVKVLKKSDGSISNFAAADCQLSYRNSIFKDELKGRYVILSITLKLTKKGNHRLHTEYGDIQRVLKDKMILAPTIRDISNAVVQIRQSKLPDPNLLPNAGSFFKNPVISISKFDVLKSQYPSIPSYPINEDSVKLPAAWMIEKCGWKGIRIGDVAVHNKQALVIVNHGGATGKEILEFSQLIQHSVKNSFDIDLEREVNVLGEN